MADEETQPVNVEQSVPSEPTQSVSEAVAPAEAKPEATQAELVDGAQGGTAQMGRNEPLDSSAPQAANASEPAQVFVGKDILVKARATIQDRKHKKLEKILEHLNSKNHITNDEVEKLLHVSDATATRYLSQLEREGKIKQIGKTGKAVTYTKP